MSTIFSKYHLLELLLALFILSGIFQHAAMLFDITIPLNLTLIIGSALLSILLIRLFQSPTQPVKPEVIKWYIFLLAYVGWSAITLIWSPSSFGVDKLLGIATVLIAAVVGVMYNPVNLEKFFQYFTRISVAGCLGYLGATAYYDLLPNYMAIKDAYLFLGKFLGVTLILIGCKSSNWGWSQERTTWSISGVVVLLAFLGARGALFFAVFLLLMRWIWLKPSLEEVKFHARLWAGPLIFWISTILSLVWLASVSGFERLATLFIRSSDRFLLLYDFLASDGFAQVGKSVANRLDYWRFCLDWISNGGRELFVGHGLGSFGMLYTGTDVNLYPHNFILESIFELGIIGSMLLILVLIKGLINIRKMAGMTSVVMIVVLFELLNLMKSHSLSDHRTLFLFIGFSFLFSVGKLPQVSGVKGENKDSN